jgi:hypothetical protein
LRASAGGASQRRSEEPGKTHLYRLQQSAGELRSPGLRLGAGGLAPVYARLFGIVQFCAFDAAPEFGRINPFGLLNH